MLHSYQSCIENVLKETMYFRVNVNICSWSQVLKVRETYAFFDGDYSKGTRVH